MKCLCAQDITLEDCDKPCPLGGRHQPDNRHAPLGERCPCRRPHDEHRVFHHPKGDPCVSCGLPATCHILPRKALKRFVAELLSRDGRVCYLCGDEFVDQLPRHPSPMAIEVDHVVPLSKGGTDHIDNLRAVHRRCNMSKGTFGAEEAAARLRRLADRAEPTD